jgi:hypothetical protein
MRIKACHKGEMMPNKKLMLTEIKNADAKAKVKTNVKRNLPELQKIKADLI